MFSFLMSLVFAANAAAAGPLDLSTSYPSPYGSYTNLRASGNAYFAYSGGGVGIGTTNLTNPSHKLELAGGGMTLLSNDGVSGVFYDSAVGDFGVGARNIDPDEVFNLEQVSGPGGHGSAMTLYTDTPVSPSAYLRYEDNTDGLVFRAGSWGPDAPHASGIWAIDDGGANTYLSALPSWRGSYVGIGTDAPIHKLDVAGEINASGSIFVSGSCSSSDSRLKKEISTLENPLPKLARFQAVTYRWTDSFRESHPDTTDNIQAGVIAQNIEKDFPELVSKGKDGYLAVDYSKLSAVLLQAVIEQQNRIDRLKRLLDQRDAFKN